MHPVTIAQTLHQLAGLHLDSTGHMVEALLSDQIDGLVYSVTTQTLSYFGPGAKHKTIGETPTWLREQPDAKLYLRACVPNVPTRLAIALAIMAEGSTVQRAADLAGINRSLLYKELADRDERGVCPCCKQKLPTKKKGWLRSLSTALA